MHYRQVQVELKHPSQFPRYTSGPVYIVPRTGFNMLSSDTMMQRNGSSSSMHRSDSFDRALALLLEMFPLVRLKWG